MIINGFSGKCNSWIPRQSAYSPPQDWCLPDGTTRSQTSETCRKIAENYAFAGDLCKSIGIGIGAMKLFGSNELTVSKSAGEKIRALQGVIRSSVTNAKKYDDQFSQSPEYGVFGDSVYKGKTCMFAVAAFSGEGWKICSRRLYDDKWYPLNSLAELSEPVCFKRMESAEYVLKTMAQIFNWRKQKQLTEADKITKVCNSYSNKK